MGPEGAVNIVYKRELEKEAAKAKTEAEKLEIVAQARQMKVEEFRERFANPYIAAGRGYVDAVIQPRERRKKLMDALEVLQNKRGQDPPKKQGNIPLER